MLIRQVSSVLTMGADAGHEYWIPKHWPSLRQYNTVISYRLAIYRKFWQKLKKYAMNCDNYDDKCFRAQPVYDHNYKSIVFKSNIRFIKFILISPIKITNNIIHIILWKKIV